MSETRDESRYSNWDTDDTRNYPTPVPAGSRSRGSYSNSPKNNSRMSGNDRGAQDRRSSLVTPKDKFGSQGRMRRGGSLSRSRRYTPPRDSREEGSPSSSRWDREYHQHQHRPQGARGRGMSKHRYNHHNGNRSEERPRKW